MSTPQFTLPFPHEQRFPPDGFMPSPANAVALAWLADPASWPGLRLAVHGEAGAGKTHFVHVFADRFGGTVLPGAALAGGQPPRAPVAIDDADAAPSEEALLHVLNAWAEAGLPVLLAARTAPARWPTRLPDLRSRLRAITAVELRAPDDALLALLLARLLSDRQLAVPPPVQAYLLARLPRTGGALREAVWRLDRASLANRRAVTRGLAAEVVAAMVGVEATENDGSQTHPML